MHAFNRLALAMCSLALALAQKANPSGKRPFTIEDIFRPQSVGGYVSPDGGLMLYTRSLSMEDQMKRFGNFHKVHREDGWIYSIADNKSTKLFSAGENGLELAGFFWSPGGRYLCLAVGAGASYQFQIWDRASGSKSAVTPFYAFVPVQLALTPPAWISEREFAFWIPPQPTGPIDGRVGLDEQNPLDGWIEFERDRTSTASVLDTTSSQDQNQDRGQAFVIDAEKKTSSLLVKGEILNIAASPDGKRLAILESGPRPHLDPNQRIPDLTRDRFAESCRIRISESPARERFTTIEGADHVLTDSLSWSPDGTQLAYLNRSSNPKSPDLYVYSLADRKSVKTQLGTISLPLWMRSDLRWIAPRHLMIYAASAGKPKKWHVVSEDGSVKPLEVAAPIPSQVYPENPSSSFLFVSNGGLWRYDFAGNTAECLVCGSTKITGIAWSSGEGTVLTSRQADSTSQYLFRSKGEDLRPLKLPAGQQSISHLFYDFKTGSAILTGRSGPNTSLLSANVFQGTHTLIAQADNSYQEEIDRGEARVIDYVSLDGQALKANVLLPYGYQSGKPYPTVVVIYPGLVYTGLQPHNDLSAFPHSDLWFSAHGYAVLEPSMPLPARIPNDNYLELTKGVLPAVDKLVELGIADPDRLAIAGHSYGGYGVYGIITQTARFKAAIAWSGVSDLITNYAQLPTFARYRARAEDYLTNLQWAEGGQGQLGTAPWQDPQRYLLNSPLFNAAKVQTPILIIQGDMDFVPIQQGEEFFIAMERLNKPARFIRYWGEGHVFVDAANERDVHRQIKDWLERYLTADPQRSPAAN